MFPDPGGVHRAGVLRPMVAVMHETVRSAMRSGPVGEALCVPSSRISEIERGARNLPEPKQRVQTLDNV